MLCFANDILVLVTSKEDLQAAINVTNIMFKEYNLNINSSIIICYKENIPTINIT